jgi:hypothetical protein
LCGRRGNGELRAGAPAEPPGDEERSAKKARNHNHMHGDGDAPVVEPARMVAARVRKRVVACVKVAVSRGCVFQGLDRRDGSWGVAGTELGVDVDAPVANATRVLHAVARYQKVGVKAILFVCVVCAVARQAIVASSKTPPARKRQLSALCLMLKSARCACVGGNDEK